MVFSPVSAIRYSWLYCIALLLSPLLAQGTNRAYTVESLDGVNIAVQEAGNPQGQAIIFVHGLLGSHLSWEKQLDSPELQRYRLITFDLRGHGLSDKPVELDAYREGRHWADDLAAVIKESGAHEPVLVGWSLGAAVTTNYLAAFGDGNIAGAVYVGGVIELKPEQLVAQPAAYSGMASSDLRLHLEGEKEFVSLCFNTAPDDATFQRMVAAAAMASREMQSAVHGMSIDAAKGLGSMHKPLLLIYGEQDALVQPSASAARTKALYPRTKVELYETSGHSPFLEESTRFNRDLSAFVDAATGH
ncbi:pimeloyl-ACP methyl ester carboxylesterase [Stenotrophomonas maltophilia]|uniref:alpha/beta fold hydrolase n=1 Tax=Stenotrophomonas chelatiphaga TaxID=517011 RepID=UPI000F4C94F2|nr:alpha/beta hydrolase [Stenotrophomonas chelatiphaga]MCS4229368.1 pimeloyl-ACP methyl ester carboxylesterase [Stenotrophomonas chelatiphaga]ROQ46176.1 pimeloyl-ACP methyl ester carboxylesterase [Stenotrophomonas maltophilia]